MPKGVYTGFRKVHESCSESGLIALFGYPARPPKTEYHKYKTYELVYLNNEGVQVLNNQKEILDALTHHKEEERFVPRSLDQGDANEINKLSSAIARWLKSQAVEEEVQADGTVKETMGSSSLDILNKLKGGKSEAVEALKDSKISIKEKY